MFHFDLYALHFHVVLLWYYNHSSINISSPFLNITPGKISPCGSSPEKGTCWMHRAKRVPHTTTHGHKREGPPGFNPYPPSSAYIYPFSAGCDHSCVSPPLRSRLQISDCHGDCFKVLLCFSSSSSKEESSTWS